MTRAQAIEYAVKKVPEILPLEESDVKALCEQILKTGGSNSDLIAQGFLDILGHDDAPFEFVIKFNQLLVANQPNKVEAPKKEEGERVPSTKTVSSKPSNLKEKKSSLPPAHINPQSTKKQTVKESKSSKAKKQQLLEEIDEAWRFLELEHNEKDAAKYACNCQGKRYPLFEIAPNCLSCGKIICVREGLHLNNCSFCGKEIIPLQDKLKIIQLLKKEKEEVSNGSKKAETNEQPQKINGKKKYANSYKISSGMGTNLFTEQDKLFDLIERQQERERKRKEVLRLQEENEKEALKVSKQRQKENSADPELLNAQERLDRLLHFQDTSAERTKIIDNASDFSISDEGGLWGSAQQRALMIKKQQRNLRKFEKLEGERNGKREKYVVSMDIGPGGKLTMKEVVRDNGKVTADSDDDLEQISDEDDRNDLDYIHALKDEIESGNNQKKESLQSKVWDYQKYGKRFQRPKYIGSASSASDAVSEPKKTESQNKPSRIQVDDHDETFWDRIA